MITMTTSINTETLFVVATGDAFGVRTGNASEDAPEAYVSRSPLKAVVRAILNADGAPVVVDPDVAVAAGRANLELMSAAGKGAMAAGLIAAAASFATEAGSVLAADVDIDATITAINGQEQADEEV